MIIDAFSSLNHSSCCAQSGLVQGIIHVLLLSMSAHLTEQLGMPPGGEFRRAFQEVSSHTYQLWILS